MNIRMKTSQNKNIDSLRRAYEFTQIKNLDNKMYLQYFKFILASIWAEKAQI